MGLKQSMRPKHQVLIMKCYPQYQKSANEVKPNPSELSYLLYYASTRRSKLQKVGAYLETRTARDVRKTKLGRVVFKSVNIQVTLNIITALIDKCPRDLPLFAPFVLNILSTLLQSHDINFVEESVPAFGALCSHVDHTTFVADPSQSRQYDQIIETYSSYASRASSVLGRSRPMSAPEALRYRTAGLKAINSLVSSDPFAQSTDHLRTVMPPILGQLVSDDALYLRVLQRRENASEQQEKDRRRQSFSAAKSIEMQRGTNSSEVDSSAAAGTAADLDQRANEELGVLALQSLRRIFSSDNRGQVRVATTVAFEFGLKQSTRSRIPNRQQAFSPGFSWLTELFEIACRWTPVQDRFIILVTAMESLISSPIVESDLPRQHELALIIAHLLRSDINLIGLSVMDVLVGLVHHVLLILQLGGPGSSVSPHRQQTLPQWSLAQPQQVAPHENGVVAEIVKVPSSIRYGLLDQLQQCIADLAVHIYYTDQIGDMVSAFLLRLKPSTNAATPASAVENPQEAVDAIADSANLMEKPQADTFFSFETARILALQSVKAIIVTANSRGQSTGTADIRTRVDISVWEGTQWLLRDPDAQVRRAYVDALLTWLDLEVSQNGLRLAEDSISPDVKSHRRLLARADDAPRRAFSSASMRKRARARAHSSFLQLLHLSIYEQALSHARSESEALLLHLLLSTLVRKLGVNSLTTGLPMIFRLQDEIANLSDAAAIVSVASLTQGYFWAISHNFEFENSALGHQIRGEISKRASQDLWLKRVTMPPAKLDAIDQDAVSTPARASAIGSNPKASLQFLKAREDLVESIADGYSQSILSPPSSPPVSPAKPIRLQSTRSVQIVHLLHSTLPAKVRAQMMENWSREACIEAAEAERGRTSSVSGSKTGSGSGRQNLLNAENGGRRESTSNPRASATNGFTGGFIAGRRFSPGSTRTPVSDSSARSVVRVDELKKALAGSYIPARPSSYRGALDDDDRMSDSMVSGDFDASEISLPLDANGAADGRSDALPENGTSAPHHLRESHYAQHDTPPPPPADDDIPPVPLLPANLRSPLSASKLAGKDSIGKAGAVGRGVAGVYAGENARTYNGGPHVVEGTGSMGEILPGRVDLNGLLNELRERPEKRPTVSAMVTPPY